MMRGVHDLSHFAIADMMALRGRIRAMFDDAMPSTFEEGAVRMARLLHETLIDGEGKPACPLVRVYKTHRLDGLPRNLQDFARRSAGGQTLTASTRCLVLAATVGSEPQWNRRDESRGHQAIPLSSEKSVESAPMVAQLIRQLGVDISMVVAPDPALLLSDRDRSYNVFFVPQAAGSPHIPAQTEFVARYGIESVIGFGGLTTAGDLMCAILFSAVPISDEVADLFKVIGLNFRVAMLNLTRLPFLEG
jgi:hypothetical protein